MIFSFSFSFSFSSSVRFWLEIIICVDRVGTILNYYIVE
jgi:hypothetical protein